MFTNLNNQLVQILYKSSIKKLEIDYDEITIGGTNCSAIPEQLVKYKNKPVRIMVKDNSGNIYELTGKVKGYSRDAVGVEIRVSGIKIKKNGKFLNPRGKLSLENVECMIVGNICRKIIFKHDKKWPFSFLLEFHVDRQQAEELKKRIEGGTPLAIEAEKYNATYKYIIKEVSSCEISENVLKIEFNGEVYRNGETCIDERSKCFTCTLKDSTYTFSQLQHSQQSSLAEETPALAVSPPQNPQAEANVNKVSNIDYILSCSKVHYSFENYKSKGCIVEFPQNEVSEYVQFISIDKNPEKLIKEIKEVRDWITRTQLDNLDLQKYINEGKVKVLKGYLLYLGKYFEFTSNILRSFKALSKEDESTGEGLVAKKLNKLEEMYGQNAQEENASAKNETQVESLNTNNIDRILLSSKVHYSFENYKSKGSTIEFSQAAVEEYVKFISENENSKKLIEEIKKLREWVAFVQVENTQKFIDENNEIGVIKDYLLYIQGYFTFTSNILSNLNALSEQEKSEGGDRLVEGQLKRIEKILKKNAQSQNERLQRRVHFEDDVKNYQEETPVSHAKQPERKIDKSLSSGEGQIPHPHTDPYEPQASAFDNTSMYYAFGATCIGFLAIGVILCAVGMPKFGGIFIAGAVMCALIVGIGKVYEQVSREKQKDPEMSTYAAVKTIFKNIFASGHQKNNNLEPAER